MATIRGPDIMHRPSWLPAELCYADYQGNWDNFISAVYDTFSKDFKQSDARYEGHKIVYDSRIEFGKEVGFWHLVQKENIRTRERLPDIRRCERISWPRPIIDYSKEASVSVWKKDINRETRIHIWLEALDYIVVLSEKPKVVVLVTAFCINYESYRRKLRRDRDNYLQMQKPPRKTT